MEHCRAASGGRWEAGKRAEQHAGHEVARAAASGGPRGLVGHCRLSWMLLPLLLLAAPLQAEPLPRYAARLSDNSLLQGQELLDWHTTAGQPTLDGQPLLAEGRGFRWLRDRQLRPAELPDAYLEMHTGDRLPGRLLQAPSSPTAALAVLDHFLVEPGIPLRPPQRPADPRLRVASRFVRRIVWTPQAGGYQPGTAFFRDGRQLPFRAARFRNRTVSLLTDQGTRPVLFSELAELHLPPVDPWEALLDELQVLSPDLNSPLLQLETSDGALLTSSLDRFRAHVVGNPKDASRWVHALQPAWSLDVLWVPNQEVWVRRRLEPWIVPLSRLVPATGSREARTWHVNRNQRGHPLRCGHEEAGWGFNVHAESELRFPLHPLVCHFQSRVGLDRSAGEGGCVRFAVYLNDRTQGPKYQSPVLVGSEKVLDTGNVALPAGTQHLVLHVDPVLSGRPTGADPFTIRDMANWLDPVLLLDADELRKQLQQRSLWQLPAWDGWTRQVPATTPLTRSFWDELVASPGSFEPLVEANQPLRLQKTITLDAAQRWLLVSASHPEKPAVPVQLKVRLGEQPFAEQTLPLRDQGHRQRQPLIVWLGDLPRNQPLTLEVEQQPSEPTEAPLSVQWHSLAVLPQLPMLHEVWEEQPQVRSIAELGSFEAAPLNAVRVVGGGQPYSGSVCLQVPAPRGVQWHPATPLAVRSQPAWNEFRYIRFAVRKSGEGRIAWQLRSGERTVTYDAGPGPPLVEGAVRVATQLSDQWIVITRDLFGDFGEMDIEELTFAVPDGQQALLDHVYLARSTADFELIPTPPHKTPVPQQQQAAEAVWQRAKGAVVTLEADKRKACGVLISDDGLILTSGQFTASAGKSIRVTLADGKQLDATSLGVDRERDVGLVKAESETPLPLLSLRGSGELQVSELYLANSSQANGPVQDDKLQSGPLRHVFRNAIWTEMTGAAWLRGGPLLDRNAQLVALYCRPSQAGGALFSRTQDLKLDELKKGERKGAWFAGSEPSLGLQLRATPEGCRVHSVDPQGPTAKLGIQTADLVVGIGDRPVAGPADIQAQLAERDPGQTISLRWQRGEKIETKNVILVPRGSDN